MIVRIITRRVEVHSVVYWKVFLMLSDIISQSDKDFMSIADITFNNRFFIFQSIVAIHNDFLDSTEGTPSYVESRVTVLIAVLIASIELFGECIVLTFVDCMKTYDKEELAKPLKSGTN